MERLEVLKTYKIYIGGKFPRTESGRYYSPKDPKGNSLGNICLSSRKDVRNAVVAARKAQSSWAERAAFNRGQILYRIAEMLEGRKAQFVDELVRQGLSVKAAAKEVEMSIDRMIYYSGWCDKYVQVMGSVNPVATSHFNFSTYEPTGVVGIIAEEESSLLGLISTIAPVIAGGNAVVCLVSESKPLCGITLAEVLNSSDVPGGVVNILTGNKEELLPHLAKHMDVDALVMDKVDQEASTAAQKEAVHNLKRVRIYDTDWKSEKGQSIYYIIDCQELKTTWHPIENIGGANSSY